MVATAVPLVAWSSGWLAIEHPAWLALPVAVGTPLLIYLRRALCCPKCERYLERGELVAIPLARKVVRNWYSVSLKKRALPNFMCVFVDELECALACKDIARIG